MKRSVSGQGGIIRTAVQRLIAIGAPLLLIGAASAQPTPTKSATPSKTAVPALYPTRAEAEKAARLHFHCSGAHPMGNQWMPCAQHGSDHNSSHP